MTKEEAKNLILQLAGDFDIKIAMTGEKLPLSDLKENKWYTSTMFDFEDVEDEETYFTIGTDGTVTEWSYGEFSSIDIGSVNFGSACKDRRYIERRLPEITLYNRLSNFAEVVNEGWKPDWGYEAEDKWFIYCYYKEDRWCLDWDTDIYNPNTVYFKTKELAQRAIDEILIPWEKEFRKND